MVRESRTARSGAAGIRRSAPTLSMRLVWPFREVSRTFGVDLDEAWAAEGFSRADLENPDVRVPFDVAERLLTAAVGATGERAFGLRAAEVTEPGLFDLVEYTARSQATLREALSSTCRLFPLLADFCGVHSEVRRDVATITLLVRPDVPPHPVMVEFLFAYLTLAMRRLTGVKGLAPRSIHFRHAASADLRRYESLFGAPVKFGASVDRITLPVSHLALPLATADSHLGALLDHIADGLLADLRRNATLTEKVRGLITESMAKGGATARHVARALAITPRTLHRRLAEEGVTFRELTDDVRRQLGKAYLEEQELSVGEIAYLLGFSSVSVFHRAFRRWTNETPGAYRSRAQQGVASSRRRSLRTLAEPSPGGRARGRQRKHAR